MTTGTITAPDVSLVAILTVSITQATPNLGDEFAAKAEVHVEEAAGAADAATAAVNVAVDRAPAP